MNRRISEKKQKPSHDKIIFHMLFGTFHVTSRNQRGKERGWFGHSMITQPRSRVFLTTETLVITVVLAYPAFFGPFRFPPREFCCR